MVELNFSSCTTDTPGPAPQQELGLELPGEQRHQLARRREQRAQPVRQPAHQQRRLCAVERRRRAPAVGAALRDGALLPRRRGHGRHAGGHDQGERGSA